MVDLKVDLHLVQVGTSAITLTPVSVNQVDDVLRLATRGNDTQGVQFTAADFAGLVFLRGAGFTDG